jgi:hypothetical protein
MSLDIDTIPLPLRIFKTQWSENISILRDLSERVIRLKYAIKCMI